MLWQVTSYFQHIWNIQIHANSFENSIAPSISPQAVFSNPFSGVIILLMDKILHRQGWWLSHYFQGFNHPRWCRISSINSITKPNFMHCKKRNISQQKMIHVHCLLPPNMGNDSWPLILESKLPYYALMSCWQHSIHSDFIARNPKWLWLWFQISRDLFGMIRKLKIGGQMGFGYVQYVNINSIYIYIHLEKSKINLH